MALHFGTGVQSNPSSSFKLILGLPFLACHRAIQRNINKIDVIFREYKQLSRQKVKWHKSSVFFGRSVLKLRERAISKKLGMVQGQFPLVHLGVPIFAGTLHKKLMQPATDIIILIFSNWKGSLLSQI